MRLNAREVSRLVCVTVGVATLAMAAACVTETGAITVSPGFQIGVSPANPTVAVGDSLSLTVTLPAALESGGATYVSANPSIAIARANGWIVGVARGKTSVTITSVADSKLSTSVQVLVAP